VRVLQTYSTYLPTYLAPALSPPLQELPLVSCRHNNTIIPQAFSFFPLRLLACFLSVQIPPLLKPRKFLLSTKVHKSPRIFITLLPELALTTLLPDEALIDDTLSRIQNPGFFQPFFLTSPQRLLSVIDHPSTHVPTSAVSTPSRHSPHRLTLNATFPIRISLVGLLAGTKP
jgi:hypothetical protein